jgi:hypothetical protein
MTGQSKAVSPKAVATMDTDLPRAEVVKTWMFIIETWHSRSISTQG